MRPIKLSMTAFGPFINTEVIDFSALGESPLFLINGTTGSGKTTILDAICFALYGQTTGNEREAMQMRCDFSPNDLLTKVEFIFELAGKHYRISRIPEQSRNKTKGEGTTKQSASAELSCLSCLSCLSGEVESTETRNTETENIVVKNTEVLLVAKKVSDATKTIEEITGLKVDQFRQVMVLPQGKFRQLLMADSKDRETIFSQLFETHIYKRIEDRLSAKAKVVRQKVAELKDNQQGVLQSVDFENIELLDNAIEKLKPEVETIRAKFLINETTYVTETKKLESAKSLLASFNNLKQQEEKLGLLKQQGKIIDEKRQQLSLSNNAQKISPIFNELSKITESYEGATKSLLLAKSQYEISVKNLDVAELAVIENPKRLIELDGLKKEQVTLDSYQDKGKVLEQEQKDLKLIQEQFVVAESKYEKAKLELDDSLKFLEKANNNKQSLELELRKITDLKLSSQLLNGQIEQRQKYEGLLLKSANLSKEIEEVTIKGQGLKLLFEQAEKDSNVLELKWHKAQAAILAKELNHDEACPVCGSKEHPLLARSEEALPTESQREQAKQSVIIARNNVHEAREVYSNLTTRLKALSEQSADIQSQWIEVSEVSLSDLEENQKNNLVQLKQHETQQNELTSLSASIEKLKLDETKVRAFIEQTQSQQSHLNAKQQASMVRVENAEKVLPEEYREFSKLEQASLQNKENIEVLDKMIRLVQENQAKESNAKTASEVNVKNQLSIENNLNEELEAAKTSWQLALSKSDFDDENSYKKVQLDEETHASNKTAIEYYDKECHQVIGAIEHQSALLKDEISPDIMLLELELDKVRVEKQQQDDLLKEKGAELIRLEKAQTTLKNFSKNQKIEEDEYKVVGTLSNVANGLTGNKISLQRFVLGVLLDDVLVDASHRLKLMSKGRYLLLRKENRSKGNRASGLELEVEDSYTGKVRPVSTLSGGESFMASLSLALGLSDVVQAYAGGIHLDTLFIDEGFGSLDADSLDLAIRTLTDLRDTGRMVGIISHVSELKEQIPLRLDVKIGDQGSYIELVN